MIATQAHKDLLVQCEHVHSKRGTLMTLWQEIADQFYVERADFNRFRVLGEEFADHLHSSYPLIVRRELGNSFSSMLRPMNLNWFETTVEEDDQLDSASKQWLQMATKRQRRAMYDRRAMFTRATKEGDQDFAAFGQAILSYEIDFNKTPPALLYRCWHLRDVAWTEKYDGTIGAVYRKWKPTVRDLCRMYPGEVHENIKQRLSKSPNSKVEVRVITVETEDYQEGHNGKLPWTKIVIELENECILEETGSWTKGYTIPRWQTVSGSQYGYSPATVTALPDGRLLQAITLTLLEAGEMYVRPPMIATQDAIRSDVNLFPGGITWSDVEYDERKGDVLKPLTQNQSGFPLGLEMQQDIRSMLASAFYLNKLSLPPAGQGGMSPLETSQRIQEYIRDALPLFEPMEMEYNGGLCEDTFDLLLRSGTFGPHSDIPPQLRGRDVHFKFRSPLHDAIERKKGSTFLETKELIREAVELDPTSQFIVDARVALRDALHGIETPAIWMRSVEDVDQEGDDLAARQDAAEQIQLASGAGEAAKSAGEGAAALAAVEAA